MGDLVKDQHYLSPPVVISVGTGHWRAPQGVVLEVEVERVTGHLLSFQRFRLLMNQIPVYEGSGFGVERFGEYRTGPDLVPELRLDRRFITGPRKNSDLP